MSYEVKILADSISVDGIRLTTLQVTFPRFILAEVNTHRVLSRNSASSRAIPTEKIIDRVREDPFIPETFNKRVKGMGVGDELDSNDQDACRGDWLVACDNAILVAQEIMDRGVDKSRVNRLLEPFMWHTAIITATEWENFFALRDHPAAQPEFQIVARMMKEAMTASKPTQLELGMWHLPLVLASEMVESGDHEKWAMISAGRCARVSFDTHENYEFPEVSYERAERLMTSGHMSPFEHQATPVRLGELRWSGNFRGWTQFRKTLPNESNFAQIRKD